MVMTPIWKSLGTVPLASESTKPRNCATTLACSSPMESELSTTKRMSVVTEGGRVSCSVHLSITPLGAPPHDSADTVAATTRVQVPIHAMLCLRMSPG